MESNMGKYWTQASANYGRIIDDELNSFRPDAWKSLILGEVLTDKTLKILDVGTGPGFFSIILSQEGHDVTGIDCSEGMLAIAEENARKNRVQPTLLMMDSHHPDFEEGSFDLIVSRNLTWTLKDPRDVYRQWHRILKPMGKLLIFDANWNHHFFNEDLMQEVRKREQQCVEKYGSTYSDDRAGGLTINYEGLPFSKIMRPDWDIDALNDCGFTSVDYIRDITEKVWDEKEKLLYGASPMFMVSALK